jgi:DNA-binding protein HU-beta
MTRRELISAVAEQTKLTKSDVERVLYSTFDKVISGQLAEGNTVAINDFGKFEPKLKAARTGRNPATGDTLEISEKMALSFKPASALKNLMN